MLGLIGCVAVVHTEHMCSSRTGPLRRAGLAVEPTGQLLIIRFPGVINTFLFPAALSLPVSILSIIVLVVIIIFITSCSCYLSCVVLYLSLIHI